MLLVQNIFMKQFLAYISVSNDLQVCAISEQRYPRYFALFLSSGIQGMFSFTNIPAALRTYV